jgi:hypothetical protein
MMMMMMSNELLDLDVSEIVTFDSLTAVAIKNTVFWVVTLRWLVVGVYRRLGIRETNTLGSEDGGCVFLYQTA